MSNIDIYKAISENCKDCNKSPSWRSVTIGISAIIAAVGTIAYLYGSSLTSTKDEQLLQRTQLANHNKRLEAIELRVDNDIDTIKVLLRSKIR